MSRLLCGMKTEFQGEISIQAAMAYMRDESTMGRPFALHFVRSRNSKGGKKGSIKLVAKCGYGKPGQEQEYKQRHIQRVRTVPQHVDKGTLPLWDRETGEFLSPLISHIIGFNHQKVRH